MTKYCPICRERYTDDQDICVADGMRLFDMEDPMVGRLIDGRYQVLEKIGSGGMGAVYRVREEASGELAAMKVLSPKLAADPLQRARFFRESRVGQRLVHENIISVLEIDETTDGLIYLVMEYLPGANLADKIAAGPLPLDRALAIAIQITRGLARAHDLGVIHRDVKPENVMFLSLEDEPDHVKLLDFGLAWMKGGAKLTATGQVFGTPEYISPEQAVGDTATPLSDLYSLGILLYEMASGRAPFEGVATQVMLGHIERAPAPPSTVIRAPLPQGFDRLVLQLLEKEPARRYRDAHHLLDDLTVLAKNLSGEDESATRRPRYGAGPSSHPPPRGSISVIETTEKRWRRIEVISRQLPVQQRPAWLAPSLEQLSRLIEEAKQLGRLIGQGSGKRTQRDLELRMKRERLGRAVDIVATDESKLVREFEIDRRRLQATEQSIASARLRRESPEASLVERRSCLRAELAEKKVRLEDIGFQLGQLRGRLGALNAAFEHDAMEDKKNSRSPSHRLEQVLAEFEPTACRVEQLFDIHRGTNKD